MKVCLHNVVKLAAVAAAMAVTSAASAQSAGQWTAKLGVGEITPVVTSGDLSAPALPHTKAAVGSDVEPIFNIGYGLTDHVSAELDLGFPYKHTLYGAGSVSGTGKLGTVKALPPTALIQYRFNAPNAMFRPYVGIGATYAYFTKATGTGQLTAILQPGGAPVSFKIDNKLAATAQVGLVVNMTERWFADFSFLKTVLKTHVHYSSGQVQEMTLNPKTMSMGIGYKF